MATVTSWQDFEAQAPDLARFARERLQAHTHVYLATLRSDGAPRISGIEMTLGAGELWLGGMLASRKFADLRRDPRLSLHSGSDDPPDFVGDARVSGTAEFVNEEEGRRPYLELLEESPGEFELVRVRIREVMSVAVAPSGDRLVYEIWRPGHAVRRVERA